jgi:hypothetical protein
MSIYSCLKGGVRVPNRCVFEENWMVNLGDERRGESGRIFRK